MNRTTKKRDIKALDKMINRFIKADEKAQKELLKRAIALTKKGGAEKNPKEAKELFDRTREVFPDFRRITGTITFTDKETENFSEPFKTVFTACDREARVVKSEEYGGGFTYEIKFRRFGYNLSASETEIEETKKQFIEMARRADE